MSRDDAPRTRDKPTELPSLGEQAAIARMAENLFGRPPAPTLVGRYEIEAKIGAGAFGVVYRARDPQLQRDVAIKVAHMPHGHPLWHARQQRESQSLARIAHPNIVSVFDLGSTADGRPFIAMEYVRGPNLRAWAEVTRPVAAIEDVLLQSARGLAAAHAAGVVHGDFKPDNVFVGDDARVRVGDFGLARTEGTSVSPGTRMAASSVAGTPAYMAAELHEGAVASAASDQFAFCVTAFEILTGARPFGGSNTANLIAVTRDGRVNGVERLPPRWRAVIARGLSPDRALRFPDMPALLAALDRGHGGPWWPVTALVGLNLWLVVTPELARAPLECGSDPSVFAPVGDPEPDPDSHPLATRAARRLVVFATALDAVTREVCSTAASATIEQFDRQSLCLLPTRLALRDFQDVADSSDARARLSDALNGLSDPHRCLGADALEDVPIEASTRAQIETQLATARHRFMRGEDEQTIIVATDALASAKRVGWADAEARAGLWSAQAWLREDQPLPALEQLADAHAAAARGSDHRLVATLALVAAAGSRAAERIPDAERWLRDAQAALERLGGDEVLAARIVLQRANLSYAQGRYDEAMALLDPVLTAIDDDELGDLEVVALHDAGIVALGLGRHDDASRLLARALAVARLRHGAAHPIVGNAAGNLGLVDLALGHYNDAQTGFEVALASSLADGGTASLTWRIDLGIVQICRGDVAAAIASFQLAHSEIGPQSVPFERVQLLANLAEALSLAGEHEEATATIARATVALESIATATHPAHAVLLATRAAVERRSGRVSSSLRLARKAAAFVGLPDPLLAPILLELGESLAAHAEPTAALEVLMQARSHAGFDARVDALVALAVARTLVQLDRAGEAKTLAGRARDAYPSEGDPRLREQLAVLASR